ncbi:MAG: hypothetical protein H6728_03255 [Myxococcales bacterium]|nr:hypothetical protein [Myxococcales bacterium]
MEQHTPPPPPRSVRAQVTSAALHPEPALSTWSARWKRFRWTAACGLYALLCLIVALVASRGEKTFAQMSYVSLAFMQFLFVFFLFFYQLASFSEPARRLHLRKIRGFQLRRWLLLFYLAVGIFGGMGLLFVWGIRSGLF